MTERFDTAAAAKLPPEELLNLTKEQLVKVVQYNGTRIKRILRSRSEVNAEVARLEVELATVTRERAEERERALRDKYANMMVALNRKEAVEE